MADQTKKIAEVKKETDGKLWVRWEGELTWHCVDDQEIATFIIYMMLYGDDYKQNNVTVTEE